MFIEELENQRGLFLTEKRVEDSACFREKTPKAISPFILLLTAANTFTPFRRSDKKSSGCDRIRWFASRWTT